MPSEILLGFSCSEDDSIVEGINVSTDVGIYVVDQQGVDLLNPDNPNAIDNERIKHAHCIDAIKIEKLIGENIQKIKDTGQRKGCGCYKSKDIGGYTGIFRCKHNCAYCYASPAKI